MSTSNRREALQLLGGAMTLPLTCGLNPAVLLGADGVGHAHASKLSVYRDSPDYEVVGIVEPDPELRQQAESQDTYRGLTWMTQEQLLNVSGLQAVLVETSVRDLLSVAETCILAGKHIHLDKPAGTSLPQFRRILDLAAKKTLLVQMGYMLRYNPGIVLLREFLKQGWLGEVFEVHTVMSKVADPASRYKFAEFPGGIMFELGGHIIDLTIGVLGKPEKVTPYLRRTTKSVDLLTDNMLAVFEYPDALATVKSSALEVDGFDRRHFVVCGTEGTFHIQPLDNPSVRVSLSTARGKYAKGSQNITLPKYIRYRDDALDMARIIRGEKTTDFSYDHDLVVQTALLESCGMSLDE